MTHVDEQSLVAYALDDVAEGTRGSIDAHLAECATCRAAFDELRQVLVAASDLPVPERGDTYGAEVWARLAPQLSRTRTAQHEWRVWLPVAAAILLVVGAFLAGRWSKDHDAPRSVPVTAAATPDAKAIRERIVLAALGDHLERTERGLVELVNTTGTGSVDISAEQAWARDLLEANRLYRQTARGAAPPALVELLDELEPILLELVHSPSQLTGAELDVLRARIENRSLVFKLRVTGADVRARQRSFHTGEQTS
jgi:hypothetical protein